jgi:hypothetical protein
VAGSLANTEGGLFQERISHVTVAKFDAAGHLATDPTSGYGAHIVDGDNDSPRLGYVMLGSGHVPNGLETAIYALYGFEVLPDGTAYVAAQAVSFQQPDGPYDLFDGIGLLKIGPDGTLDTNFGGISDGFVRSDVKATDFARAGNETGLDPRGLTYNDDGKLVISGMATLQAFTSDGYKDDTFGNIGEGLYQPVIDDDDYTFIIAVQDGFVVAGMWGEYAGSFVTVLHPPVLAARDLTARGTDAGTVQLHWTGASTDADGYAIERRELASDGSPTPPFQTVARVGAGVADYTDAVVRPGVTYEYRVYAYAGDHRGGQTNAATASVNPVGSWYALLETVLVPADGTLVESSTVLESGVRYLLRVSGRFAVAGSDGHLYSLDGEYMIDDQGQWVDRPGDPADGNPVGVGVAINGPGRLQFSQAAYTVREGTPEALITVTRTGGLAGPATVSYRTTAATSASRATAEDDVGDPGADYQTVTGVLSFDSGQRVAVIHVPIADDAAQELTEQFGVELTAATGASLGDRTTATVSVADDDWRGKLEFETSSVDVTRDGDDDTVVTLTVKRVDGWDGTATVDYATADGTTGSGSFYVPVSGTLTFADGEDTQTIDVTIPHGTPPSEDATFLVKLSNPTGGVALQPNASAEVTVAARQRFELVAPPTVKEGAKTVVLYVQRKGDTSVAAGVDFATADGTATGSGAGADYVAQTGHLTFLPGHTSLPITIKLNDDAAYEGTETFHVVLSNPTGIALGDQYDATVSILDNDPTATVAFAASTATLSEGVAAGTVALTVSRTGNKSGPVTLRYVTSDDLINGARNYTPADASITIPANQSSATINIPILNDLAYDGDDKFYVDLVQATGAEIGTASRMVVTVVENDQPSLLQFTSAAYSVAELGGQVVLTVRRPKGGTSVGVHYVTGVTGDTAGAGDYTAQSGTIEFGPTDTSKTITVAITDDTAYEPGESFTVTLDGVTGNATLAGGTSVATVTIADDDAMPVLMLAGPPTVTESASGTVASFTVTLNGSYAGSVTVDYATGGGTATTGSDYVARSGTLMFSGGQTTQTVDVTILDDALAESDETFALTLSGPSGATIGSAASASVTILANDPPAVFALDQLSYRIDEGAGELLVQITRSGGTSESAGVTLNAVAGTATNGSAADYTFDGEEVWFNPEELSKTVHIPIVDDLLYEAEESFTVTLGGPEGNATIDTGGSTATVTIADDDPMPVLTVSGPASVNEGAGTVTFVVTREGNLNGPATVNYSTGGGSAVGGATGTAPGADYVSQPGTLTFVDGQPSATVTVPIIDDASPEPDEAFSFTLAGPNGAVLGTPSSATVTILTNDAAAVLSFVDGGYWVNEGDESVAVLLERSGDLTQRVGVSFAAGAGSTAIAGTDYTLPGQVWFEPGELSKTVFVPLTDNLAQGADKTLVLALAGATTGAVIGRRPQVDITIADDDALPPPATVPAEVGFAAPSYSIDSGGTARVTVVRTGDRSTPVTAT